MTRHKLLALRVTNILLCALWLSTTHRLVERYPQWSVLPIIKVRGSEVNKLRTSPFALLDLRDPADYNKQHAEPSHNVTARWLHEGFPGIFVPHTQFFIIGGTKEFQTEVISILQTHGHRQFFEVVDGLQGWQESLQQEQSNQ